MEIVLIYAEINDAKTNPNKPVGSLVNIAGYAKSFPNLSWVIFGKAFWILSKSGKTTSDARATRIQGQGLRA